MDEEHIAKIIRLEEKQNAYIRQMDQHVKADMDMLEGIMKDIKDIYDKLNTFKVEVSERLTRQETILWIVGALVVLITPTVTAFVVAWMMK